MAGREANERRTVFISHAATDEPIAKVVRDEVQRIFADRVEVFASSVPGVIQPGAEWLKEIRDNLTAATAVIVIVSPTSINRPWVWFEVGASWSKMEQGEGRIIPVCVPEIDKGSLPEPLSRLHAMSLGKAVETKEVFKALIDQFGFGKIGGFRYSTIKAKLPKYDDLPVADADLRSGTLYTGPYEGYSDEELALVLDDTIVKPNWNFDSQYPSFGDRVFGEQLLHFRQLDEDFNLPPGSAKRSLSEVVTKGYPARIANETGNTIRFTLVDWEDYQVWKAERGEY